MGVFTKINRIHQPVLPGVCVLQRLYNNNNNNNDSICMALNLDKSNQSAHFDMHRLSGTYIVDV